MSKIKYCEICGGIGAKKKFIEVNDFACYICACPSCFSYSWEDLDLEGKNREELLVSLRNTRLPLNGSKSCIN